MTYNAPHLILISGPVGVGKTTVAQEMSALLALNSIAHTFVDLDALTHTYPRPEHDPFGQDLALKNLRALWENAQEHSPRLLLIARVIETAASAKKVADAVAAGRCTIIQLTAREETLIERVRKREKGSGRDWHEARAVELSRKLSETDFADHVCDTDNLSPTEVAAELFQVLEFDALN
ncbi:MAG: AAA family ATPase [Pseudomonadota bacterium]